MSRSHRYGREVWLIGHHSSFFGWHGQAEPYSAELARGGDTGHRHGQAGTLAHATRRLRGDGLPVSSLRSYWLLQLTTDY